MNMPLVFFLIFLRPFITSIAVFFLKFEYYSIRGVALDWVRTEATSPICFISFNLTIIDPLHKLSAVVSIGIHSGPFFSLYINDLNNVSTVVKLILVADESNLFMSHRDPVPLAASLNFELNKSSAWFKANKLSLNLNKTSFMSFKSRQERYHFPMQICINEQRIEQVKETVVLGVFLDEHLTWKQHISHVARKILKSIGFINRARFFLPKSCLRTLY